MARARCICTAHKPGRSQKSSPSLLLQHQPQAGPAHHVDAAAGLPFPCLLSSATSPHSGAVTSVLPTALMGVLGHRQQFVAGVLKCSVITPFYFSSKSGLPLLTESADDCLSLTGVSSPQNASVPLQTAKDENSEIKHALLIHSSHSLERWRDVTG